MAMALGLVPAANGASAERYWEFADRRSAEMATFWRGDLGFYQGEVESTTRINANMLVVHALAAQTGHVGPARADERASSLVDQLLSSAAWTETGTSGQVHAPGWTASLTKQAVQHVSIDPQVVEGLVAAFHARDELGLTAERADLIVARVRAVAHGEFFRWPSIRLNQWNWQADLYAADWAVSGDAQLMREDYRAQLVRFVASARQPAPVSPWLTEGLGLRYLPHKEPGTDGNRTSTSEYGGIVLSGLRHYDGAIERGGMQPLDPSAVGFLRAYVSAQLHGDWTHAGYLNWDSALGFRRWHLLRYWPLAATGLLAVAQADGLASPEDRRTAAYVFDAALDTYERWDGGGLLPSMAYGITGPKTSIQDRQTTATRWAALTARAAASGMPSGSRTPAAWFAFDREVGRLAISTRRYWTALTPTTPTGYGGAELARLHATATGEPLSGTGGHTSAAFGMSLRQRTGETILETQSGSSRQPVVRWSLNTSWPRGAFERLAALATLRHGSTSVRIGHEFREDEITTERVVRSRRKLDAVVRFPVWGEGRIELGSSRARKDQVIIAGDYSVRLDRVPGDARLSVVKVSPQRSSPGTSRAVLLRFTASGREPTRLTHTVMVPQAPAREPVAAAAWAR